MNIFYIISVVVVVIMVAVHFVIHSWLAGQDFTITQGECLSGVRSGCSTLLLVSFISKNG